MKKQLGILAGSVLLASSANAITVGSDVLVVFNTVGNGSFYEFASVSSADLAGGTGFTLDATAAAAALGGSIDSFSLIGLIDGDGTGAFVSDGNGPGAGDAGQTFNYDEGVYVENNGGLLTAGGVPDAMATDNTNAGNRTFAIEAFLSTANLGFNGEGSLGDFDGNANVASLLTNATVATTVVLNAQQEVGFSTLPTVVSVGGVDSTAELVGTEFSVTAVPVPAAAWLFGSALVGLGVVRRKK